MKQNKKENLLGFELFNNKEEHVLSIYPYEANTIEEAVKIGQRYAQYHPGSLPISIRQKSIVAKTVRVIS